MKSEKEITRKLMELGLEIQELDVKMQVSQTEEKYIEALSEREILNGKAGALEWVLSN